MYLTIICNKYGRWKCKTWKPRYENGGLKCRTWKCKTQVNRIAKCKQRHVTEHTWLMTCGNQQSVSTIKRHATALNRLTVGVVATFTRTVISQSIILPWSQTWSIWGAPSRSGEQQEASQLPSVESCRVVTTRPGWKAGRVWLRLPSRIATCIVKPCDHVVSWLQTCSETWWQTSCRPKQLHCQLLQSKKLWADQACDLVCDKDRIMVRLKAAVHYTPVENLVNNPSSQPGFSKSLCWSETSSRLFGSQT